MGSSSENEVLVLFGRYVLRVEVKATVVRKFLAVQVICGLGYSHLVAWIFNPIFFLEPPVAVRKQTRNVVSARDRQDIRTNYENCDITSAYQGCRRPSFTVIIAKVKCEQRRRGEGKIQKLRLQIL